MYLDLTLYIEPLKRRTSLWGEEDGRKASGARRWAFVNLPLRYENSDPLTKFQRKQSRNSNGLVIRATVALRLRSAIVGYSFRISINAELNHVLVLGITSVMAYIHELNVSVKVELIHARDVDSENSREKIEVAVFPFDPDVEGGIS